MLLRKAEVMDEGTWYTERWCCKVGQEKRCSTVKLFGSNCMMGGGEEREGAEGGKYE